MQSHTVSTRSTCRYHPHHHYREVIRVLVIAVVVPILFLLFNVTDIGCSNNIILKTQSTISTVINSIRIPSLVQVRYVSAFQSIQLVVIPRIPRHNRITTTTTTTSSSSLLLYLSTPSKRSSIITTFLYTRLNHNIFSKVHQQKQVSSSTSSLNTMSTTTNADSTITIDIDPYIYLEDIESDISMEFAKSCNTACINTLGNPVGTTTYERILQVLESKDRIPFVSQYGYIHNTNNDTKDAILYNFWKDANHPKGIWRTTTMSSYCNNNNKDDTDSNNSTIEWETILDIDALAKQDNISWVWKGNTPLPRSRDDTYNNTNDNTNTKPIRVTRSLISLSNGGSDAIHIKEYDLLTNTFVTDQPFIVAEGKTRISYKSRNVTYIGTNFGNNTLTNSGYPKQIREWVRGTSYMDAPILFEGETTDVSVGMYIIDERIWDGSIYEIQYRSITFYTSKYWIRKVPYDYLYGPNDPRRIACNVTIENHPFISIPIQDDAKISFVGNMILINLRSDWTIQTIDGTTNTYKQGSLIYTDIDTFLLTTIDDKDKDSDSIPIYQCKFHILFEPSDRTAYEYYTVTKNYFILSTMDNVKSKLTFYKICNHGTTLIPLENSNDNTSLAAQIRDCSISPVDPYSGSDEFWYTVSDYITPSTLYMADASKMDPELNQGSVNNKNNNNLSEQVSDPFIINKLKSLPDQFNSTNVIVEQRFATSKDGTEIPYFIIMPKDIILNGQNPTLLYGYGGFEVSLTPHYIASSGIAWIERGGIYVEGNIRGGGEFGPKWHQAGLQANRNKCYEDFIAIAEHLISSNLCTPKTLAARGGSNGGLLMGNMYVQRPDLFGAIHCAVPLLDMKRYHTLLAGASWMAEYGNPDTDDWQFLQKYSPYHNIDPNADYPPILVTTSTRDDRVHPGHARKFVKKLMDMNSNWPVYYYENIEGGHGGAADAKQTAFMTALAYDFMYTTLINNIAK